MEKKVIKNWIKAALVLVLGCIALVLLISEPNEVGSMSKWLISFVAVKAAAIVCGVVAYKFAEKLTKEIKEA